MSSALSPARRRAPRAARWLAAALGGLALTAAATAAQAQQTAPAVAAQPTTHLLTMATPIAINTVNWSPNAGYGSQPPAWSVDIAGVVHLQGAAVQISLTGPSPYLIGTLPAAVAPTTSVFATVNTFDGTTAGVVIDPTGGITVIPPTVSTADQLRFVSLDGVSYATHARGFPLPVNDQNWSYCGGCGTRAPSWYTDDSDVVHLQGAVRQYRTAGNDADLIATLPAAAVPAQTVYTIVHTAGGYADLAIEPNGTIDLIDPRPPAVKDYRLLSLESITYRAATQGSPIALNDWNWSGEAGFGSRPPAWYLDDSGQIHLQGAVAQIRSSGNNPSLIGTLPAAAAPAQAVHVVVHTYLGTYADLTIQPSGALTLTAPPQPFVTDYTFVSLEGITFQP